MSKNKKKEEKQIIYPVLEMDVRGKLILPENVITQINYLHGKVGKEEWSGMLLYDVKSGSPAKPEELVLEAKHIYLMDVGTAAYTEYETDGDIVDIYDNIEEAMEWKTGHIHTHHSMDAYFSGTDMSELNDNVDKHNYYLSLIVNFGAKYTAKVAFLSEVEKTAKMNYVDDAGLLKDFVTEGSEKYMVTIDMDIFYGMEDKFFYDRYSQLLTKQEDERKAAEKNRKARWNTGRQHNGHVVTGYKNGELTYGNDSQGSEGENFTIPGARTEPAPFEGNPKEMNNLQVEKLARNIFSVTPELSETRSIYQILYLLAAAKEAERDFYYDWLGQNIELIMENFFDQDLEIDEMQIVVDEIINSTIRFASVPALVDTVRGINDVLTQFVISYEVQQSDGQLSIEQTLEMEAEVV